MKIRLLLFTFAFLFTLSSTFAKSTTQNLNGTILQTLDEEPENQKFLINITGRGSYSYLDPFTVRVSCKTNSSCLCAQIYDLPSGGARAKIYVACEDLPTLQFDFGTYTNLPGFDGDGDAVNILTFHGCSNFVED